MTRNRQVLAIENNDGRVAANSRACKFYTYKCAICVRDQSKSMRSNVLNINQSALLTCAAQETCGRSLEPNHTLRFAVIECKTGNICLWGRGVKRKRHTQCTCDAGGVCVDAESPANLRKGPRRTSRCGKVAFELFTVASFAVYPVHMLCNIRAIDQGSFTLDM